MVAIIAVLAVLAVVVVVVLVEDRGARVQLIKVLAAAAVQIRVTAQAALVVQAL